MPYITPENIIKQRINGNPFPEWDVAVLCFHGRERSNILVENLNAKQLGYKMFYKLDETDIYEGNFNNKRFGVLRWCTGGGPITAVLVEELAFLGVKHLIGYGAAASIDPNLKKGDQILAGNALITDGTSRVYCSNEEVICGDENLVKYALDSGKRLGINIHNAKAATVDAFYRETDELIKPWREKGAQVLNWEITPLYAASKVCGIKTLWIGHISDRAIENEKWEDWFDNRDTMHIQSSEICKKLLYSILETQ